MKKYEAVFKVTDKELVEAGLTRSNVVSFVKKRALGKKIANTDKVVQESDYMEITDVRPLYDEMGVNVFVTLVK